MMGKRHPFAIPLLVAGTVAFVFAVAVTVGWVPPAEGTLHDVNTDDITTVPGADTPWYAVGMMPVLLLSGPIVVLTIAIVYVFSLYQRWVNNP